MPEFVGWVSQTQDFGTDDSSDFINSCSRKLSEQLNCSTVSVTRLENAILISGDAVSTSSPDGRSFFLSSNKSGISNASFSSGSPDDQGFDISGFVAGKVLPPIAIAIGANGGKSLEIYSDYMAMQPIYYCLLAGNQLLFATDMRLLLGHPKLDRDLSSQSIFNFVHFHIIPSPDTIYTNIKKLLPACKLSFEKGMINLEQYWPKPITVSKQSSGTEMHRELRTSLQASVRQNIGGETTAACFLSGGLDSSTIAGMSSLCAETHAFSIGFDQPGYDEMEFAKLAADHFSLKHHTYYVSKQDVFDTLPMVASSFGEPFANLSAIPVYHCGRLAQEAGFESILAGDGGDELFAGNERYIRQKLFGYYQLLPQKLRMTMEPLCRNLLDSRIPFARKVGRYVDIAKTNLPTRLLDDFEHFQGSNPSAIFQSRFLQKVDTSNPIHLLAEIVKRSPDEHLVEQLLWVDWNLTLSDNDLRKVHYMCKAARIRPLFPMLNSQVIELSRRIPSNQKLTTTKLRRFYKAAVGDFLPNEIINKRKQGFGLPFGEWLRDDPQLSNMANDILASLKTRGIFRNSFVEEYRSMHMTGHASYYGTVIGALLLLELWLQEHEKQDHLW